MCISCNLDNEAKKPWLLQRKADPPPEYYGPHVVQHSLALAIDSSDSSDSSETKATTETRLDQLEKVMQERMEEMSRLLQQVLADKVQSGSS